MRCVVSASVKSSSILLLERKVLTTEKALSPTREKPASFGAFTIDSRCLVSFSILLLERKVLTTEKALSPTRKKPASFAAFMIDSRCCELLDLVKVDTTDIPTSLTKEKPASSAAFTIDLRCVVSASVKSSSILLLERKVETTDVAPQNWKIAYAFLGCGASKLRPSRTTLFPKRLQSLAM